MRLTLKKIKEALEAKGYLGVELVKGEGYFYFIGGECANFAESGVMCYHLNDLTLEQWIDEYEVKLKDLKTPDWRRK